MRSFLLVLLSEWHRHLFSCTASNLGLTLHTSPPSHISSTPVNLASIWPPKYLLNVTAFPHLIAAIIVQAFVWTHSNQFKFPKLIYQHPVQSSLQSFLTLQSNPFTCKSEVILALISLTSSLSPLANPKTQTRKKPQCLPAVLGCRKASPHGPGTFLHSLTYTLLPGLHAGLTCSFPCPFLLSAGTHFLTHFIPLVALILQVLAHSSHSPDKVKPLILALKLPCAYPSEILSLLQFYM